jgi:hypothetical protein
MAGLPVKRRQQARWPRPCASAPDRLMWVSLAPAGREDVKIA